MDLLSGTVTEIINKLDEDKVNWRGPARTPAGSVNQKVHKVILDGDRVFYVEEVRPGRNVSVVFAPPAQAARK
jgi:hypothetical protein